VPESILKTISGNLNCLKEKKQVQAVDIANALGVSQSTVANWLHGRKMPRAGHIQQLAIYFGVSKSEILTPINEQVRAIEISPEEEEVFSKLTDESRRVLFDYAAYLLSKQKNKE
jgi:transcriptional regulator with XRE-family HTH domain